MPSNRDPLQSLPQPSSRQTFSYTNDYCNALFYNLPKYLWQCFAYLKSLNFFKLYQILYSIISLLMHTCLHGYAPTCLKNLINSRSVSNRYSLHVNDDICFLQNATTFRFARSQSTFPYASLNVEICCHYICVKLKRCLFLEKPLKETMHVILIEPLQMLILFHASILQLITIDLIPLLWSEFISVKLLS